MPLKNRKLRKIYNHKRYMRIRNLAQSRENYKRWKESLAPGEFYRLNRIYVLKYRFGLTPELFIKRIKKQHGKCKLCKEKPKKFVVDHNHSCCPGRRSCGKCIRGLLCIPCNAMLGQLDRALKIGLKKVLTYIGSSQ